MTTTILHALLCALQESIQTMVMVAGVCSRIKSTPLLFGIASYFRFILLLFCTGLPWVMFALKAEWPVVIGGTIFVTYAFLSLDEIAVDCEEPFGLDDTDLPLANFVNIIQSSADLVVNTESCVDQIVSYQGCRRPFAFVFCGRGINNFFQLTGLNSRLFAFLADIAVGS